MLLLIFTLNILSLVFSTTTFVNYNIKYPNFKGVVVVFKDTTRYSSPRVFNDLNQGCSILKLSSALIYFPGLQTQTLSMMFRSGEYGVHSSNCTFWSLIHCFTAVAVWMGALSCWNVHGIGPNMLSKCWNAFSITPL